MLFNMVLPGAAKTVPPDENTLLLLHGEDLTDGSIYEHAITNSGVTASPAQSKFGGESLYFNGSSRLVIPYNSMFDFGTGDFTVDMWVNPASSSADNCFIGSSTTGAFFFGRRSGNSTIGVGRVAVAWDTQITSTLQVNTWNHLAVVRSQGTLMVFVNGALIGSAGNTNSYSFLNAQMVIGAEGTGSYFNGYIDEFRISNVARWTENFTPPTEPYNPSGGSGGGESESFGFAYSGSYTDNRVNGVGTVRLNTSGTLTVTGKAVTVTATIVGAGGGGAWAYLSSKYQKASGGGGGIQTVEVTLKAGTYEIVIGTGGAGKRDNANITGGTGGSTTAFGYTSTGGKGGKVSTTSPAGGEGGTPNGNKGSAASTTASGNLAGGSPNGGAATSIAASNNGGDGYVELTFI